MATILSTLPPRISRTMPNTICAISSSPPEAGRSPAGAGRTGRAKHAPSRRHDPPSGPILHHLPPAKPMSGRSSRAADAALGGCASGFPVVVLPFGFFPGLLLVLAKFLCGIAAAAHLSPQPAAPATVGLGKDQGYGRSGRLPPGAGFLVSFVTHTGSSHPATAANNTPCVQQRAIPGPGARCLGLSAVTRWCCRQGASQLKGYRMRTKTGLRGTRSHQPEQRQPARYPPASRWLTAAASSVAGRQMP
ncbi:hypothetical protein B0G38_003355 [Arthrobacter sp. VKM Ac-2550]|nr:hypothetical protein [Arthrobacter sp. VKM Ac-2550]